jgi:hypothetical protein
MTQSCENYSFSVKIIIGVRDRGKTMKIHEKTWKFGQLLGKIKKIRAHLSENMFKSG